RMPQDGDPLDPEIGSNGFQIAGEHVEGEAGGLARRLSAAPQIDEDELEVVAQLWRHLPLVRLRADTAQNQARGSAAAGGIEQLGTLDGNSRHRSSFEPDQTTPSAVAERLPRTSCALCGGGRGRHPQDSTADRAGGRCAATPPRMEIRGESWLGLTGRNGLMRVTS